MLCPVSDSPVYISYTTSCQCRFPLWLEGSAFSGGGPTPFLCASSFPIKQGFDFYFHPFSIIPSFLTIVSSFSTRWEWGNVLCEKLERVVNKNFEFLACTFSENYSLHSRGELYDVEYFLSVDC